MNKYSTYKEVMADMNNRGYTHDFMLFGNKIFWIQKRELIQSCDFTIMECHQAGHPDGHSIDLVILGVHAIHFNVKGILLKHYSFTVNTPPVIIRKIYDTLQVSINQYSINL